MTAQEKKQIINWMDEYKRSFRKSLFTLAVTVIAALTLQYIVSNRQLKKYVLENQRSISKTDDRVGVLEHHTGKILNKVFGYNPYFSERGTSKN